MAMSRKANEFEIKSRMWDIWQAAKAINEIGVGTDHPALIAIYQASKAAAANNIEELRKLHAEILEHEKNLSQDIGGKRINLTNYLNNAERFANALTRLKVSPKLSEKFGFKPPTKEHEVFKLIENAFLANSEGRYADAIRASGEVNAHLENFRLSAGPYLTKIAQAGKPSSEELQKASESFEQFPELSQHSQVVITHIQYLDELQTNPISNTLITKSGLLGKHKDLIQLAGETSAAIAAGDLKKSQKLVSKLNKQMAAFRKIVDPELLKLSTGQPLKEGPTKPGVGSRFLNALQWGKSTKPLPPPVPPRDERVDELKAQLDRLQASLQTGLRTGPLAGSTDHPINQQSREALRLVNEALKAHANRDFNKAAELAGIATQQAGRIPAGLLEEGVVEKLRRAETEKQGQEPPKSAPTIPWKENPWVRLHSLFEISTALQLQHISVNPEVIYSLHRAARAEDLTHEEIHEPELSIKQLLSDHYNALPKSRREKLEKDGHIAFITNAVDCVKCGVTIKQGEGECPSCGTVKR